MTTINKRNKSEVDNASIFPRKANLRINRFLLVFVLSFYTLFVNAQAPNIISFAPISGNIGSIVTITGANFNLTSDNNIVYFGPIKATVLTATGNSLTVKVPPGASYKPITVTNISNGLTGFSAKPFHVTFPGGDEVFTTNTFGNPLMEPVGVSPNHVTAGDIDTDGKPDLVSISDPGGSAFTLSYLRNTSSKGRISFAPAINKIYSGGYGRTICMGDLDGDGKQDLVSGCVGSLYIFRNTSTPGDIVFSNPLIVPLELNYAPASVEISDLDKDGKPEIIFIRKGGVHVLKNTSTPGNISLAGMQTLIPEQENAITNQQLKIADFDGDTKPDIAIAYFSKDSLFVIRNTSSPGTVSFEPPVKYFTGSPSSPAGICIGDVDGDGLLDISVMNYNDDRLAIYRNVSTVGRISFEHFSNVVSLYSSSQVTNGDINGDGKIDFVVDRSTFYKVAIIRNNSIPCQSSLDALVLYDASCSDLLLSDINGDGKPELMIAVSGANGILIFKNNIGQTVKGCAGNTFIIPSSLSGFGYKWQEDNGSGYVNINDNSVFTGTTTASLQIKNVPSSWNGYKFRCVVDTDTSNVFSISVKSTFIPLLTISNCPKQICSGNNTILTTKVVNGGMSPEFQWQDSTGTSGWINIAGATTSTLNYTATVNGSKVRCQMKSSFSCSSPASVTSNIVTLSMTASVTPAITISGNTTVTQGQSTSLTATATHGGTAPLYQWQDSTGINGWMNIPGATSPIINYVPERTGNKIRCVLTSNTLCATMQTLNSQVLTFTVNTVTAIPIVSANNYHIIYFPNPAGTFLYVDSLKLRDNWQKMEIIAANGATALSVSLKGFTRLKIDIRTLPAGIYFGILRRKNNVNAYLKFVKQ